MSGTETLSSAEASLCCGEAGEKEKRGRGARREERKEKRGAFFLLPIVPRALSIFSIIAIFVEISSGNLCGGERYL